MTLGSYGPDSRLFRFLCCLFVFIACQVVVTSGWCDLVMEAGWSENPCVPGRPLLLTVTVQWKGDATRYAVRPPEIQFPEQLVHGPPVSSATRLGETSRVVYRWEIEASEKGDIPSFPVKLAVLSPDEAEPTALEIKTDPLVVDLSRWKGLPVRTWILLGAALVLGAGGCLWLVARRRKTRPSAPARANRPGNLSCPNCSIL